MSEGGAARAWGPRVAALALAAWASSLMAQEAEWRPTATVARAWTAMLDVCVGYMETGGTARMAGWELARSDGEICDSALDCGAYGALIVNPEASAPDLPAVVELTRQSGAYPDQPLFQCLPPIELRTPADDPRIEAAHAAFFAHALASGRLWGDAVGDDVAAGDPKRHGCGPDGRPFVIDDLFNERLSMFVMSFPAADESDPRCEAEAAS